MIEIDPVIVMVEQDPGRNAARLAAALVYQADDEAAKKKAEKK